MGKTKWIFKQKQLKLKKIEKHFKKNEILVTDSLTLDSLPSVTPIRKFSDTEFPPELEQDLKVFEKPTVIQSVSWPVLFNKRDMVGIASTGSGKTMAFGLPALMRIQNSDTRKGIPLVLVISPTRELAMQIDEQFKLFGKSSKVRTTCIYGGVPKSEQKKLLLQGTDAIIATPGRLIDLMDENSNLCDLSQVEYLVLDEADRMLDQGFEKDIRKIIASLPVQKQTVMFSATWPQCNLY